MLLDSLPLAIEGIVGSPCGSLGAVKTALGDTSDATLLGHTLREAKQTALGKHSDSTGFDDGVSGLRVGRIVC